MLHTVDSMDLAEEVKSEVPPLTGVTGTPPMFPAASTLKPLIGAQSMPRTVSAVEHVRRDYAAFMTVPLDVKTLKSFDEAPMQITEQTPLVRLQFYFAMLNWEQVFVTRHGLLVGIVGKDQLQ